MGILYRDEVALFIAAGRQQAELERSRTQWHLSHNADQPFPGPPLPAGRILYRDETEALRVSEQAAKEREQARFRWFATHDSHDALPEELK